jgi:F-type H+-transporting ATPase subunit gamma
MEDQVGCSRQIQIRASSTFMSRAPRRFSIKIVPIYLNYQLWRVLLESNAAEQGARMVAMDNATSNADDLLRDLKLKYNQARQSAITTEIIEITSGANALEGA